MWKRFSVRRYGYALFGAVFLIAVFLFALNQISETDTGFLVKTGEYIAAHAAVPLHDVFSSTAASARWIAHYWIPSLYFYFAETIGGLWGIVLSVALVAALTFFFLMRTVRARGGSVWLAYLLTPLFFGLTFKLWSARPQIFSYCLTALLILLLERYRRTGDRRSAYAVPLLMLFWANAHAGVVLGLAIVALFVVHTWIEGRAANIRSWWKNARFPTLIGVLSFGAALANPNGIAALLYAQIIAPVAKELVVAEWLPLFDRLGTWQSQVFLWFMGITAVLFALYFWHRSRTAERIDIFELGLVLGAIALPLTSIRQVIFFPLITFPIFISAATAFAEEEGMHIEETLGTRPLKNVFWGLLVLFVIAGGVTAGRTFASGPVDRATLPVGAADFIVKTGLHGPMFNLENGGYLIWRLWPGQKVFMDERNEVYRGTPVEDYLTIVKQNPGWRALVDQKYGINYFILWYRPPLDVYANNMAVHLMNNEGFKLVYWDDAAIVLVRDTPENRDIIGRYAYSVVNPFRDPMNIPKDKLPRAIQEIRRAEGAVPDSIAVARYAKLVERLAAEAKTLLPL